MALIDCKECNSKISDNATSCPNCGNPNIKPTQKSSGCSTWIIIFCAILLLLFLIGTCNNSNPEEEPETVSPISSEPQIRSLTATERKQDVEKIRNMFLDTGADIKVKVYGKTNEILELEYVLFDDVWYRKFETTGIFDNFHKMGFKKIILNDGYNYNTSITYKN
jgi:hypothetical protein